MVRGLPKFREHFEGLDDQYVLIGGAAIDIAMEDADLDFRVTKDLDIVLHAKSLDPEFARRFWEFVEEGGYEYRQKSTGKPTFYRFHSPKNEAFPFVIELFAVSPELVDPPAESHLTPLPISDEVSSLSAILLDDDYYEFLQAGIREQDGLSVLAPAYIVPLKARAWLDLTKRREAGEEVTSKDIKKHRNDIVRLAQLVSPTERVEVPEDIARDLREFSETALMDGTTPADLGVKGLSIADVQSLLASVYQEAGPPHGQ